MGTKLAGSLLVSMAFAAGAIACKRSERSVGTSHALVDAAGERAPPPPVARRTAARRSFLADLREQAHGEPLFLYKKKRGGIVARTISGAVARDLIAADPREAMWDPVLDLLWIRTEARLDVIDLREAVPAVVSIASGLPEIEPIEIAVGREGEKGSYTIERPSSCDLGGRIQVKWMAAPDLIVTAANSDAAKLVGRAWLETNASRLVPGGDKEPASTLTEFLTAEDPQKVGLPRSLAHCDDPDDCGMALRFGATGLLLVLVGATDGGDCRHSSCLLYDPLTKTLASPHAPTKWRPPGKIAPASCGPFPFEATGNSYLTKTAVCSATTGCVDLDGEAIDWIQRGPWVGVP